MIESKTIRQSADDCDVHRNTAFRWRHRFLLEAHDTQPQLLSGIVESDETFFRKQHKNEISVKFRNKMSITHQFPIFRRQNLL